MKGLHTLWIASLASVCLLVGYLMNLHLFANKTADGALVSGAAVIFAGTLFFGTGFATGIIYLIDKNKKRAMWLWTLLIVLILSVMSF
ncbi:MAG: hypothetical protein ISR52_06010 [Rhodospirillales bacterium]|nr:hypothetical protein [Rhodospirillales bacterium]